MFKLDPKRVEEFVAKNGARFDGFTPEARATGWPVPMPAEDGQIESVDLYCLDAASLLKYVRLNRQNAEQIVFALLNHGGDGYAAACEAFAKEMAAATEVPPPVVDPGAGDADCG